MFYMTVLYEEDSYILPHANVAKLADAQDLGSCPARGAGSTPAVRIGVASSRSVGLRLKLPPFHSASPERCGGLRASCSLRENLPVLPAFTYPTADARLLEGWPR
jgi:hypothetical protein